MRISIVINNYNYAAYLPAAVDSALAQTHPDVEVIAVDDGSTDNSLDVLALYEGRVRVVAKANGGQASALNAGYAVSQGDLIIFLDADDILAPECAARVAAVWNPAFSKLHYNMEFIDGDGARLGDRFIRGPMPHGDLRRKTLSTGTVWSMPMSGNCFSRPFLDQVMPMPEQGWERGADVFLFNLAALAGEIGAIDEPLGQYRLHGSNDSAAIKRGKVDIAGLTRFLSREQMTDEALADFAALLGLPYVSGTLTATLPHIQQRFILDHLASNPRLQGDHPAVGLIKLCGALPRSGLSHAKQLAIAAWALAVDAAPSSLRGPLIVAGYRHGFVVAVSKTIARSALVARAA